MSAFFVRERFGRPQIFAALLLLSFAAQCLWLIYRVPPVPQADSAAMFRVQQGLRQWQGRGIAGAPAKSPAKLPATLPAGSPTMSSEADEIEPPPPLEFESNEGFDPNHSPLWYLTGSAPLLPWPSSAITNPRLWASMQRAPFLLFGLLLGVSLWYVARRLYGNAGGYIALSLYSFSPIVIRSSSLWMADGETGAAWGAFGAIFTAIAVAHTLYAPREVILWNWKRCTLLAISLLLAVGSQFSLIVIPLLALAFMLYLAPTRRVAAVIIWLAACAMAALLLLASYSFRLHVFRDGLSHASFVNFSARALAMTGSYRNVGLLLLQSGPALAILLLLSAAAYALWRRARYFGNTAPLLVAVLLMLLGIASPHYPGFGFQLIALPFLMLFVAGIFADLLETLHHDLTRTAVSSLLIANSLWNVLQLSRIKVG